ncbi:MAG: hypothetical protein ABMB14_24430 [Myxococcota bacterium]
MLIWTLLLACTGGDPSATGTDGPVTDGATDTEPTDTDTDTDTDPTTGAVTFYADLRPLLAESCARCHTGSGLGPGSFLDYEVVTAWAEVMLAKIDAGTMPPPAADPSCHPYQDQDLYTVDPALRDTLAAWIEAGEPAGTDPGTVIEPRTVPTLESPDIVLKSAAPRVPDWRDGNEYRCFLIGRAEQDEYLTAVEFLIDHPEITHHALLLVDRGGGSAGKVTDQASQSWACSVIDLPGDIIHAWAPSGGALTFPAGTGMKVEEGDEFIIQMHYFESVTDEIADQPGYAFDTAPTVDKEMFYWEAGPLYFSIPAGDPSYTKHYQIPVSWVSSVPLDVWGTFPHMHVLGTGYDFHAKNEGGGETCISRASEYDFTLQPTYWFDEPVTLQTTDTLSVDCTWDNSADNPLQLNDPPVTVHWGENTQDEMCYAFLYVTPH